jgi:hypothetical protein
VPFNVGECTLWARLAGPQLAAQVTAAVNLVMTVAKDVVAIIYINKTDHSITKFLESPFAGKHPKHIQIQKWHQSGGG